MLLTGAIGYVGGRLLGALEARGERVRCLAREPRYVEPRAAEGSEVVAGDVFDPPSLARALAGVDAAYYLVHSMGAGDDFAQRDREAARNFAAAAREAGVSRIIYLGGLGRGPDLSEHLRSRQEVGRILRESGVPTVELRASIVIGSGSLSFELVRALVEKLPVMIAPSWVSVRAQPIAIEDVLEYLVEALDLPERDGRVFEIGGPDRVSYGDLMREYARLRGLRRWIVPVPVLTPKLSSLWLGLVTPVYARVGRKLVDSIRNETVLCDDSAAKTFSVRPRGVRAAMERALANEDRDFALTRWSDALSSSRETPTFGGARFGPRLVDSRSIRVPVSTARAFAPVHGIGGRRGWYYADGLWSLRGALDLLVGGPGMRRGRPEGRALRPGDALDFWRVERVERDALLRLRAEMRLPGRAWLQFEVEPENGDSRVRQTAIFDPVGIAGRLYWYALWPLHALIFRGMLRHIARRATEAGS